MQTIRNSDLQLCCPKKCLLVTTCTRVYSTDALPLPGSIGRLSLLENGFKPEGHGERLVTPSAFCAVKDVDQCFTVTAL